MKPIRILTSLAGASLVVALTMALVLPAQEPEPSPVESTPPTENSERDDGMRELGADAPAVAVAEADAPAAPPAPGATIGEEIVKAIVEDLVAETEVAVETESGPATSAAAEHNARPERGRRSDEGELVQFFGNAILPAGEKASHVVAIFGDAVIDGDSDREVVAILGNVTINGSAGSEAVAVLGDVIINGTVNGQVVAVMGSVQLGPAAVVNGEIVCIGGAVDRAPGAVVNGAVNQIPFVGVTAADGLRSWVQHCLLMGRPLAFAPGLGWLWMIMLVSLGVYALIALIVPSVVTRAAETMENYPGMSLLSALLTLVITPIAMIVLSVTVVGPFVLGLMLLFAGLFGKVVFLAWLGRRITEPAGWKFPALAVLIGGIITLAIYLVPILGFVFQKLSGFLGLGIVVYTIILALQENGSSPTTPTSSATGATARPVTPPPSGAPAGGPGLGATAMGGSVVSDAAGAPTAAAAMQPPPTSAAAGLPPPITTPPAAEPEQLSTLPRAGFWARFAATLIDVIALGIAAGILNIGEYFPVLATGYFIVLWALKGTTLGGVVLGIKIVRVDDQPVDWAVALVRSLGAFLSLCIVGLGFIWVVWDPRRQSWHDKIAGTTIVKMPKGVSLI